jgi:hypothetical protein
MKNSGPEYASGDRVRLLRLEEEFFSGMVAEMDPEVVARLKSLIGLTWTVEDWHIETGTIGIVFKHPPKAPTPLEWIWVPPEWIERIV